MNASVLLAHPYEGSFNHALFERVTKTFASFGVQIFAYDLYREGFDPVLTREELGKAPTTDPLMPTTFRRAIPVVASPWGSFRARWGWC